MASIEDSCDIDGVLLLLNTMGGDVEAGLAIAEMMASLSKPTVSLVLGGSHSIGVPIAVSTNYSFYRSFRDNGHSSGKNEWYGNRCSTDFLIISGMCRTESYNLYVNIAELNNQD